MSYLQSLGVSTPEEGRLSHLDVEVCKAAANGKQDVYEACVRDKIGREKTSNVVAIVGGALFLGLVIWKMKK
jgi:hypothetical protein